MRIADITLYLAASTPYWNILFAQYWDIGAIQVLYTSNASIHFCVRSDVFSVLSTGRRFVGLRRIVRSAIVRLESLDTFVGNSALNSAEVSNLDVMVKSYSGLQKVILKYR